MVRGKKQETNTGGKAKLPDHYRCTITCAFCGKRKQYKDECYRKQRVSAKLKNENGSGKGSGKASAGEDSGKGKSKPDKNKNAYKSGGSPLMCSRIQGPTTPSQTEAWQEQGTKRANKDGDQSNAHKRSLFMCMSRKLQKMGFEVTFPCGVLTRGSGGCTVLLFWVRVRLGEREYPGVLDTGATLSIVAKNISPRAALKNIMPTVAIRMADGHVVQSFRDCEVEVPMGSRSIAHWFHVMDSETYDFVLTTYFLVEHSQIISLTLQAPYVVQVDHGDGGESVPLEQSEHTSSHLWVCKKEPSTMMVASKPEGYQLLGDVLDQGLKELGYSWEDLNVELFASDKQHVLDLYCSKGKNCCYKFYWPSFLMAYGNPRIGELGKVLTNVALERSRMVLCSPDWGAHGGNEYWRNLLYSVGKADAHLRPVA